MEKVKSAICGACLVIVAILGYCYISEKQNEKYEYIVNSAISRCKRRRNIEYIKKH